MHDGYAGGGGGYRDEGGGADPRGGGRPQDRPGGKSAPARRTGPPAALPPGPSASQASAQAQASDVRKTTSSDRPAGEVAPREERQPAAAGAEAVLPGPPGNADDQARRPTAAASTLSAGAPSASAPSASTLSASAPPSPSGMIPPGVGEVPDSSPPDANARADAGYDTVSPEAETTPMAVILGDGPPPGQPQSGRPAASADEPREHRDDHARARRADSEPATGQRVRGPFEAFDKTAAGETAASSPAAADQESAPRGRGEPEHATAKMDQIKDLYLTAEAIGEDALDKHFELVSDRQRQLIREYFNQAVVGQPDSRDAAS